MFRFTYLSLDVVGEQSNFPPRSVAGGVRATVRRSCIPSALVLLDAYQLLHGVHEWGFDLSCDSHFLPQGDGCQHPVLPLGRAAHQAAAQRHSQVDLRAEWAGGRRGRRARLRDDRAAHGRGRRLRRARAGCAPAGARDAGNAARSAECVRTAPNAGVAGAYCRHLPSARRTPRRSPQPDGTGAPCRGKLRRRGHPGRARRLQRRAASRAAAAGAGPGSKRVGPGLADRLAGKPAHGPDAATCKAPGRRGPDPCQHPWID